MSRASIGGSPAPEPDQPAKWRLPRLHLTNDALGAMKWLALLLMTGDHVNKYLFNGTLPSLYEAGRLAMPLFTIVLAANLARPDAFARGVHRRVALRLCLFGLLATPLFIALGGLMWGGYPLNILFTLLVITLCAAACERAMVGKKTYWAIALLVFLFGGALVEFWWPAVLLGLSMLWYLRSPNFVAIAGAVVSFVGLSLINGNVWAVAALPVLLLSMYLHLKLPRWRWLFYVYYPLHLLALLVIRIPMAKAGYLFLI